jgi:DNA-binding protein HU-beta
MMRQSCFLLLCLIVSSVSSFVVQTSDSVRSITALAAEKKTPAKKPAVKAAADAVETFKKADLILSIAEKSGLSKKDAESALTAVLSTVEEQVALGKKVSIPGFGTFVTRHRSARKGRNPQTGAELDISASKSPGFTAAKAWKDMLNGKSKDA